MGVKADFVRFVQSLQRIKKRRLVDPLPLPEPKWGGSGREEKCKERKKNKFGQTGISSGGSKSLKTLLKNNKKKEMKGEKMAKTFSQWELLSACEEEEEEEEMPEHGETNLDDLPQFRERVEKGNVLKEKKKGKRRFVEEESENKDKDSIECFEGSRKLQVAQEEFEACHFNILFQPLEKENSELETESRTDFWHRCNKIDKDEDEEEERVTRKKFMGMTSKISLKKNLETGCKQSLSGNKERRRISENVEKISPSCSRSNSQNAYLCTKAAGSVVEKSILPKTASPSPHSHFSSYGLLSKNYKPLPTKVKVENEQKKKGKQYDEQLKQNGLELDSNVTVGKRRLFLKNIKGAIIKEGDEMKTNIKKKLISLGKNIGTSILYASETDPNRAAIMDLDTAVWNFSDSSCKSHSHKAGKIGPNYHHQQYYDSNQYQYQLQTFPYRYT